MSFEFTIPNLLPFTHIRILMCFAQNLNNLSHLQDLEDCDME